MAREFIETRLPVYNRGKPPVDFLEFIVDWAKDAPDEVFAVNSKADVYSHIEYKLGPWNERGFLRHRRAVMLEVLRVLAGFESSWDWTEGRDVGAGDQTICEKEAGILQCSGNSMRGFPSAGRWAKQEYGVSDCFQFRAVTRQDRGFAIEYCARLLRETYRHHGPLKRVQHVENNPRRHSLHPFLSRHAVEEFMSFL